MSHTAPDDAPRATTESFPFRSSEGRVADVERSIIITGDQVTDAQANYDENGRPQVNINLDSHGGELMNRANLAKSLVATRRLDSLDLVSEITPKILQVSRRDPERMSANELAVYSRHLVENRQDIARFAA